MRQDVGVDGDAQRISQLCWMFFLKIIDDQDQQLELMQEGYRSPIPNLYNAGSAGHPGGAISGGAGYITASVIAGDLGIKPWWTPWNARASLEMLPQLEKGAA